MSLSRNGQRLGQDPTSELELNSDLLTQLIETIRTTSSQEDDDLIALIRNARSLEDLERNLARFKNSVNGRGGDRSQRHSRD